MVRYRGIPNPNDPLLSDEYLSGKSATLATSPVQVGVFTPKSMINGVIGVQFKIDVSLTAGSTAVSGNTVGDQIKEIVIKQGAKRRVDINGIEELQHLYNILTGLDFADVDLNPAASSTASATLQTPIIPLHFKADSPLSIEITANALPANATAGTITITPRLIYYPNDENDQVAIISAPTALNTGVDVDVKDIITIKNPIKEAWVFVGADSNLNHTSFYFGNVKVHDSLDASTLIDIAQPYSYLTHIDGLLPLPLPYGVLLSTNQQTNAPKVILNLAASYAPKFYVFTEAE